MAAKPITAAPAPGYYWLIDHWTGSKIVARFDGEWWTFTGSDFILPNDEVLGPPSDDHRTYDLGDSVR